MKTTIIETNLQPVKVASTGFEPFEATINNEGQYRVVGIINSIPTGIVIEASEKSVIIVHGLLKEGNITPAYTWTISESGLAHIVLSGKGVPATNPRFPPVKLYEVKGEISDALVDMVERSQAK